MNKLPTQFIKDMQAMLGDGFEAFIKTYEEPWHRGIRINTLKISKTDFLNKYKGQLDLKENSPIPWCSTGYYYSGASEESAAKSPLYNAGLFYIQEPSAMSPVEYMDIKPGMRVLDLCAAPGGKSTQIAAKLQAQGLLVANDISLKRTKAILKNIEIQGITNAVITNAAPEELAGFFGGYFDRILVDAPCSGEGMFRKDSSIIKSYKELILDITDLQLHILTEASKMLKDDGMLMYSTCTFNTKENEEVILKFLEKNQDFEAVDTWKKHPEASEYGFSQGLMGIKAFRLYPHKIKGEGHFLCLLRKKTSTYQDQLLNNAMNFSLERQDDFEEVYLEKLTQATEKKLPREEKKSKNKDLKRINPLDKGQQSKEAIIKALTEFLSDHLTRIIDTEKITVNGTSIYKEILDTKGAKFRIIRNGLYLGDAARGTFEPSSALIMSLKKEDLKNTISLALDDMNLTKYLKCETLDIDLPDGLYFVCADKYPLGYTKIKNKTAKNFYNKNWRLL